MIYITKNEFKMLLDDFHPEYKAQNDTEIETLGHFFDNGKGADIIYEKMFVRLSDNKVFALRTIYNNEIQSIHEDFTYDCDFTISARKTEQKKQEEKKPEIKEKFPDFDLNLAQLTMTELDTLHKTFKKAKNIKELQEFLSLKIIPISNKYKIDSSSLYYFFTSPDNLKNLNKIYKKIYHSVHNLTTEITIQGHTFQLTEKEIEKILKKIK